MQRSIRWLLLILAVLAVIPCACLFRDTLCTQIVGISALAYLIEASCRPPPLFAPPRLLTTLNYIV